jgi:flagellin-like hook-associated protein FlgL
MNQRISIMAESRNCRMSSLAFIDAIIADMEQNVATKMAHPQFDIQMIFIKKLRAQLEQNCSATDDADYSAELVELRRLQARQSQSTPATALAKPASRQMLSLFR